jgi:hypothetical protein
VLCGLTRADGLNMMRHASETYTACRERLSDHGLQRMFAEREAGIDQAVQYFNASRAEFPDRPLLPLSGAMKSRVFEGLIASSGHAAEADEGVAATGPRTVVRLRAFSPDVSKDAQRRLLYETLRSAQMAASDETAALASLGMSPRTWWVTAGYYAWYLMSKPEFVGTDAGRWTAAVLAVALATPFGPPSLSSTVLSDAFSQIRYRPAVKGALRSVTLDSLNPLLAKYSPVFKRIHIPTVLDFVHNPDQDAATKFGDALCNKLDEEIYLDPRAWVARNIPAQEQSPQTSRDGDGAYAFPFTKEPLPGEPEVVDLTGYGEVVDLVTPGGGRRRLRGPSRQRRKSQRRKSQRRKSQRRKSQRRKRQRRKSQRRKKRQ